MEDKNPPSLLGNQTNDSLKKIQLLNDKNELKSENENEKKEWYINEKYELNNLELI